MTLQGRVLCYTGGVAAAKYMPPKELTLGMSGEANSALLVSEHQPYAVPIWRESLLGVDWVKLRSSPVYYGIGVPKGDKSAVVLVPGFLGYDFYLVELYGWLWRMKYKPFMSKIGHNADCPDILVDHLVKTARKAREKTGRRVHLVGHSLGGVISRGATVLHEDLIASVTTLGSPIRGVRAHPAVLSMAEMVRRRIHSRKHLRPVHKPIHEHCFTSKCRCQFSSSWREEFPKSIPQTNVYTKTDGIVDWEVCMQDDPQTDVEVRGTHCGLVWNPAVYNTIGRRLAEACKQDRKRA